MDFKVSYGTSMWAYCFLNSNQAGFDQLDDMDDRAVALAAYIVRECMEDAGGWCEFTMDDVIVTDIYGESCRSNADSVEPSSPNNHGTFEALVEQCETLVKLHDLVEDCHDVDKLMATIKHQEWDSFDFDDRYWSDQLFTVVEEDDYESFAKEEMEVCDAELPEHRREYFNYDKCGRDLIENDYYMTVFNGYMYVFNRC